MTGDGALDELSEDVDVIVTSEFFRDDISHRLNSHRSCGGRLQRFGVRVSGSCVRSCGV